MNTRDARLHAFRADLADERLKGEVTAERFVPGRPARVATPVADVRTGPRADAGLSTQFLCGDAIRVFDEADDWAWVQAERDGYVGYLAVADLEHPGLDATHVVAVPRTFLYPGPDLRLPRAGALSLGSTVAVTGAAETRGTAYAVLASGAAVVAAHLAPVGQRADDYVAVAESLAATPYLWGGASAFGIDCSGLVQLAMRMTGRDVLRDSDMQAAALGAALDPGPGLAGLRRGDLVFWKGHVAIVTGDDGIVHASGHTMMVSREGLREAIGRIGHLYGQPTGFRRP